MQSTEGIFMTERLPLAVYFHASGRLSFSRCEPAGDGKVQFIFADPSNEGDHAELEFESGAVVPANSLFASQKYLRRKMTETLNNRNNENAYRF
jgi:hypothetical protein